jgi:hypothetical protein
MTNRRKPICWMDPQARHDHRHVLEASLLAKNGPSGEPSSPEPFEPIASAMSRHPGLTAEEALDFAKSFGF